MTTLSQRHLADAQLFERSLRCSDFWKFKPKKGGAEEEKDDELGPCSSRGTIMTPGDRMALIDRAEVDRLAFGLLSPIDIRRRSVAEVTTATLEERGFPKQNGPNDLRSGSMNRMQLCQTCEGDCLTCQGHPMHLELPRPVLNISLVPLILRVMRCICIGCAGLRATEEVLEEMLKQTHPGSWTTHRDRRLVQISNLLRKRRRCLRCGDVCPDAMAKGFTAYWVYTAKDVEAVALLRASRGATVFVPHGLRLPVVQLTAPATHEYDAEYALAEPGEKQRLPIDNEFLRTALLSISDTELTLLGLSPTHAHPAWAVMDVLLIPPPCVRPAVRYSESAKHRSEHDFTTWIQEIVRAKSRLIKLIQAGQQADDVRNGVAEAVPLAKKRKTMGIRQATRAARNVRNNRSQQQLEQQAADELAGIVCGYMNCESSAAKSAASSRHHSQQSNRKSLMTVQSGKKGQWRGNTQGKRVDYSARTVACPTVALDPHEVGFPTLFGKTLTQLSVVQAYNINLMRERVRKGAGCLEGATSVVLPDKTEVDVGMLQSAQREMLAVELSCGMSVRHPMPNGQRVLQNRQPTLRRGSMMAHSIRHQPGSLVETLNTAVVGASNTDFDGDAHNAVAPQCQEARSEMQVLMAVEKQIISSQSHKPLFGLIQDSVIAAYRLTDEHTVVARGEAMQAVMQCNDSGCIDRYVERHAGAATITGRELFSCLLPAGFHFKQTVQRDTGTDVVRVRDGRLISGRVCKRTLGSTSRGLIHAITRLVGDDAAIAFLGDAQRLLGFWLSQHTLSIGLQDCLLPDEALGRARTLVTRAVARTDHAVQEAVKDDRTRARTEGAVEACLRKVVTQAGTIALAATANAPTRGFRDTVDSGAKGTIVNLSQVLICVGQQNAQGSRIGTPDARTLSCFPTPSRTRPNGAAARGFVSSSFSHGLTPPEMFFHFVASWDALMDTSVRTSLSGYGQRKMSKAAEDVVVQYDGTLRHSNGTVVDFTYGSDGMDSALLDPVDIPELAVNATTTTTTTTTTDPKTLALLRDCRLQRQSILDGMPGVTLYLPFNADQRLRQAADAGDTTRLRQAVEHRARERLEEFCYFLCEKEEGRRVLHSTAYLRLHLRLSLTPEKVARFISTPEGVDRLYRQLDALYHKACVQAGEVVGLLAAENIGEPFTQLVLNVFHTAGITQIASTQGIPRLKEIIDATVHIRTPSMSLFAAAPDQPLPAARLPLRPLDDFVRGVHVFRQPAGLTSLDGLEHEDTRRVGRAPTLPTAFVAEQQVVVATTALLRDALSLPTHASPYAVVLLIDHADPDAPSAAEAAAAIRHYLGEDPRAAARYMLEESAPGMLNRFVRLRITGSQDVEDRCREDTSRQYPNWSRERVEAIVDQLFHSMAHSITHKVLFGAKVGRLAAVKVATTAAPNDRLSRAHGEQRILTVGSCLRETWNQPELDWARSFTNDIIEVEACLGIEAATSVIFSELRDVVSSGGSGVADRHIALMATIMTASGTVTSLTRYGDARLGITSAVVRASFEKQNAHIIDAGVYAEDAPCALSRRLYRRRTQTTDGNWNRLAQHRPQVSPAMPGESIRITEPRSRAGRQTLQRDRAGSACHRPAARPTTPAGGTRTAGGLDRPPWECFLACGAPAPAQTGGTTRGGHGHGHPQSLSPEGEHGHDNFCSMACRKSRSLTLARMYPRP